jgi:hypothetical protein
MKHGRYTPNSGHSVAVQYWSLWAMNNISHRGKVSQIQRASLLRGASNPHIDFGAQCTEVDWLGQQCLSAPR